MTRSRTNLHFCILLSAAFASLPLAAATTIREFVVPSNGFDLTAGADGAVWLTMPDATALGRVAADGTFKSVNLPSPSVPPESAGLEGIALAPDGSLWAAAPQRHSIFRLSLAGVTTEFQTPDLDPFDVTMGPDGSVWFDAARGTVGRITTAGQITLFAVPNNGYIGSIASGPDGNLWLTEKAVNRIARITVSGGLTEFTLPHPGSGPLSITPGFNNDLWFTETDGNRVGRMTPSGVLTEYELPHPDSQPITIVRGPDGNMWFTEYAGRIGRITPQGVVTEVTVPVPTTKPAALAVGPDGNLWFTETQGINIGRLTLGGTPGPCSPRSLSGNRHKSANEVKWSPWRRPGFSGTSQASCCFSLQTFGSGWRRGTWPISSWM